MRVFVKNLIGDGASCGDIERTEFERVVLRVAQRRLVDPADVREVTHVADLQRPVTSRWVVRDQYDANRNAGRIRPCRSPNTRKNSGLWR